MKGTIHLVFILITLGLLTTLLSCAVAEEAEHQGCAGEATEAKVYFLHIKPASDDPGDKMYRVVCKNDAPVHYQTVDIGDWVAWTHSLEKEKVIKIKFSKDLPLFGLEHRIIRVYKNKWTWMRVQEFAAFGPENKHEYKVDDYTHDDPPPGVIVNPPPGSD